MTPQVLILLFAIWADSLSAQPRIFMTVRAGSSVVLPCEWRDALSRTPHIEWRTISETVFERMGEEQFQGEGYEDRVDVPQVELLKGNCSLVLKNVRPADEGVYESYLMVKRMKRSLQTKRVFIQSVELSVEDTEDEVSSTKAEGERRYQSRSRSFSSAAVTSVSSRILTFTMLTNLLLYLK